MKNRDARSLSAEAQEEIRIRAIQFVISGNTQVEAAKVFGVTRQAVGKWVKKHHEKGKVGLRAGKKGRPKGGSLEPWQAAQVVRTIEGRCPDQLKLPFYLWTREAVGKLVEQRFEIRLSLSTIGRYLRKWEFSPQKPIRRAWERNPLEIKEWLEKEYPSIRRQAKVQKAQIFWGDEMGLRSDHSTGRSFSRRGVTPIIDGTGRRFGCNMISAITNKGRLHFSVFKGKFNATVFITFLRRLIRQNRGKLFLIIDGHPVHRSVIVRNFIKENNKSIRLVFLPGYCPELNPDELLNQDVKSNTIGRQRPHTQIEMVHGVRNYLHKRQRQPHIVQKYFHERNVRYAAL
jgi:transposase